MHRFVAFMTFASLIGCATHPPARNNQPPAARVYKTLWSERAPQTGTLVIRRDSGSMNQACQMQIAVNAQIAADLLPKEEIRLYPPAGEYIVRARLYGLCGGGIADAKATVRSGETEILRVAAGQSGDLLMQQTSE